MPLNYEIKNIASILIINRSSEYSNEGSESSRSTTPFAGIHANAQQEIFTNFGPTVMEDTTAYFTNADIIFPVVRQTQCTNQTMDSNLDSNQVLVHKDQPQEHDAASQRINLAEQFFREFEAEIGSTI